MEAPVSKRSVGTLGRGGHVIGIDGGGSHSRLVAIDKNKKILGRSFSGSTNLSSEKYDVVFANIKALCDIIHMPHNDCLSICIGSAGISNDDRIQTIRDIFRKLGYTCPLKIMNDAELVLLVTTNKEPGIIIISGTGSIGYAIDDTGELFRVGGWGHIIDDGGSGYRIGMDAVKFALMDLDRRGSKTILTNLVLDFLNSKNAIEVCNLIYNDFNKSKIAEMALIVKDASIKGDKIANAIEQKAAEELISLACTLINISKLFNHKIVLSGGVILNNANIRTIFEKAIYEKYPNMQIISAGESIELGAAYLALDEV